MERCFLLNVDSGHWALFTTLLLSHNTQVGPSMGFPNILNLKPRPSIASRHVCPAMNSAPNVDASTVFCRLEYHRL
eukprot:9925293-Ditylum_brightwellii.AAC.1